MADLWVFRLVYSKTQVKAAYVCCKAKKALKARRLRVLIAKIEHDRLSDFTPLLPYFYPTLGRAGSVYFRTPLGTTRPTEGVHFLLTLCPPRRGGSLDSWVTFGIPCPAASVTLLTHFRTTEIRLFLGWPLRHGVHPGLPPRFDPLSTSDTSDPSRTG